MGEHVRHAGLRQNCGLADGCGEHPHRRGQRGDGAGRSVMSQLTQLPRFVLDLLAACPAAGTGVHNWVFRVARVLHPFYADKHEMAALIGSSALGCGRDVPLGEIEAAIANSEACAWQPVQPTQRLRLASSAWPKPNREQIEAIVAASDV